MSVIVSNLTKVYGEQRVVDGISFEVKKGEILGFLGPNGAGKSTTMKIATGFIPPTSGTILVEGYDVVASPVEVRKNIGYLPEHNPLYLDMYVYEYLEFIGSLHSLGGKALKERISEMINLVGLNREQNKKIGTLSKGYRQRVGLAQPLIHDPAVLFLDEPTTGLDPNQIVEIRNVIKTISTNKTVIFSTHIMQEVQALCDRVVIINLGQIVANNKVEELKNLHKNEVVLIVEFDREIDLLLLNAVDGVKTVSKLSDRNYKFTCGEKDVRPEIFRIASENNWTLVGLRQEESSLENIFQQLTKR